MKKREIQNETLQRNENKDFIHLIVNDYLSSRGKIVDWGIAIVGCFVAIFGVIIPILLALYGWNISTDIKEFKRESTEQLSLVTKELEHIRQQKHQIESTLMRMDEDFQNIKRIQKEIITVRDNVIAQQSSIIETAQKFSEVIPICEKIAKEAKDDAALARYNRLLFEADNNLYRKQYKDAIDRLNLASQIIIKDGFVYQKLATVYLFLKDYQNALKQINLAIAQSPDNFDYYNSQGLIYIFLNNNDKALESFDMAITTYHKNEKVSIELSNVLSDEFLPKIDGISFSENLNIYSLYANKAIVLFKLKRYDDAELLFKKSLDINSNCPEAWQGLGYVYHAKKMYIDAIQSLSKSVNLDENLSDSYYYLGVCQSELNRLDDAEKNLTNAIGLNPQKSIYYSGRAHIKLKLEKVIEAKKDIDQAFILGENSDSYKIRALYHVAVEEFSLAQKDLENAIKLSDNPVELYFLKIICLLYIIDTDWRQVDNDMLELGALKKDKIAELYFSFLRRLVNIIKSKNFQALDDLKNDIIQAPMEWEPMNNNLGNFIDIYKNHIEKKSFWQFLGF